MHCPDILHHVLCAVREGRLRSCPRRAGTAVTFALERCPFQNVVCSGRGAPGPQGPWHRACAAPRSSLWTSDAVVVAGHGAVCCSVQGWCAVGVAAAGSAVGCLPVTSACVVPCVPALAGVLVVRFPRAYRRRKLQRVHALVPPPLTLTVRRLKRSFWLLAVTEFRWQISTLTTSQIQARVRMLEGNIRALQTESNRLDHEKKVHDHRLKENLEKVKLNKQLPYLISNVVEVRRHHGRVAGAYLQRHCPVT